MDGFKKIVKMKTGGSVNKAIAAYEKKESKSEAKMDLAQDKAIVKKGVRQHESALHKGEPKTELKLKTGGRAKKAKGTVKKFEKASGEYGAKKTAEDKKNIKEAKKFVPAFKDGGKACAPSAAKKAKNTPAKFCGGKSVKKMAVGGQPGATEAQQKYYNKNKAEADKKAAKADYEAFGSRGDAARKGMEEGRMDALGNAYKKGGKAKVKKYADGGAVLSDEEKAWLGGADATDPFILARMREALGPKKPTGSYVPNANPTMDNRDVGTAPAVAPVRSTDVDRLNQMAQGQGVFPEGSAALPGKGLAVAPAPARRPLAAGPSADERLRMRNARPYAAPNVEQDSGLEYPVKPTFTTATPGQQAAQFNKGIEARKNIGRRIGDWLGLNKKPGV